MLAENADFIREATRKIFSSIPEYFRCPAVACRPPIILKLHWFSNSSVMDVEIFLDNTIWHFCSKSNAAKIERSTGKSTHAGS